MSNGLWLAAVLLLNMVLATLNCYVVGTSWKDAVTFGTWFDRLVLRSAIVQSGVGFSMPSLILLSLGALALLTGGENPTLTPDEANQFLMWVLDFWYVSIILPVLATGWTIWIFSIREAFRRRDFISIAALGWNSYANISNSIDAVRHLGGRLNNVGELFKTVGNSGGSGKGKLALYALVIVVVSLIIGFSIAYGLVRFFARRADSRIEQYAREELGARA